MAIEYDVEGKPSAMIRKKIKNCRSVKEDGIPHSQDLSSCAVAFNGVGLSSCGLCHNGHSVDVELAIDSFEVWIWPITEQPTVLPIEVNTNLLEPETDEVSESVLSDKHYSNDSLGSSAETDNTEGPSDPSFVTVDSKDDSIKSFEGGKFKPTRNVADPSTLQSLKLQALRASTNVRMINTSVILHLQCPFCFLGRKFV